MGKEYFARTTDQVYDRYTEGLFGGFTLQNPSGTTETYSTLTPEPGTDPWKDFTQLLYSNNYNPLSPAGRATTDFKETSSAVYDFGALRAAMHAYNSTPDYYQNKNASVSRNDYSSAYNADVEGRAGRVYSRDLREIGTTFVKGPWWWAFNTIVESDKDDGTSTDFGKPWEMPYKDPISFDTTKESTGIRKRFRLLSAGGGEAGDNESSLNGMLAAIGTGTAFTDNHGGSLEQLLGTGNGPGYISNLFAKVRDLSDLTSSVLKTIDDTVPEILYVGPIYYGPEFPPTVAKLLNTDAAPVEMGIAPEVNSGLLANARAIEAMQIDRLAYGTGDAYRIQGAESVAPISVTGLPMVQTFPIDSLAGVPTVDFGSYADLLISAGSGVDVMRIEAYRQIPTDLAVSSQQIPTLVISPAPMATDPGMDGVLAPSESGYSVADTGIATTPAMSPPADAIAPSMEAPVADRDVVLEVPAEILASDIAVRSAEGGSVAAPLAPDGGIPGGPESVQYGAPSLSDGATHAPVYTEDFDDTNALLADYLGNDYSPMLNVTQFLTGNGKVSPGSINLTAYESILAADIAAAVSAFSAALGLRYSEEESRMRRSLSSSRRGLSSHFDRASAVIAANKQAQINDFEKQLAIERSRLNMQASLAAAEMATRANVATAENYLRAVIQSAENGMRLILAQHDAWLKACLQDADAETRVNLANMDGLIRTLIAGAENLTRASLTATELTVRTNVAGAENYTRAVLAGAENTLRAATTNAELITRVALANQDAYNKASLTQAENGLRAVLSTMENRIRVALALQEDITRVALSNQEVRARVALANQDTGAKAALANQDANLRVALAGAENAIRVALANQDANSRAEVQRADNRLRVALATYETETRRAISVAENKIRIALANHDAELKMNLSTQENDLRRQTANQDADLRGMLANQEARLRAETANQEADLRRQTADQEALLRAAIANQEAYIRIKTSDQDSLVRVRIAYGDAEIRRLLANQDAELRRLQANQETAVRVGLANQDVALKTNLANQDAGLRSGIANQEAYLRIKVADQEMLVRVLLADMDSEMRRQLANQDADLRGKQANQDAVLRASVADQDADLKRRLANQDAAMRVALTGYDGALRTSLANQDADVRARLGIAELRLRGEMGAEELKHAARLADRESELRRKLANQDVETRVRLSNNELRYKYGVADQQRILDEFTLKQNTAKMMYDVYLGWMNAYGNHLGMRGNLIAEAMRKHTAELLSDREFWLKAENQRWQVLVQRAQFIEGLAGLKWKSQLQNLSVMQQTLASLGQATGTVTNPSTFENHMTMVSGAADLIGGVIGLVTALA